MKKLNIKDIAKAVKSNFPGEGFVTDIVTDSRKAESGSLFVPIIGENMDGHKFIAAAFENGAAFALSSDRGIPDNGRILYVEDTKKANIAIGGLYRDMFDLKVVGVTGSVGKTTTKEFTAAVLETKFKVLKNLGNKNNEIGLPETVLRLDESYGAAVLEMGMSGLGEIHDLTMAVRPDVAIITNVYGVHLEYLGSIDNIKKAKLEIADGMKPGSVLLLCGDNEQLKDVKIDGINCLTFGKENPECDIKAVNIIDNGRMTTFDIASVYGTFKARIPTTGAHFVLDALAAFGAGCALGVNPEEAAAALWNYAPSGMRQKPVSFMGATVMEDCYNASPISMHGAIDTLKAMPCDGKRIAVFSDMLELGASSVMEHMEIGRAAARAKLDMLLAYGENASYYIAGADEIGGIETRLFDDKAELAKALREIIRKGDICWVKGSRGMQLEDMLNVLYGGAASE